MMINDENKKIPLDRCCAALKSLEVLCARNTDDGDYTRGDECHRYLWATHPLLAI